MKKLIIKDIEKAIEESGVLEYPKYIGNGLWKLSENCITSRKGLKEFYKALSNTSLDTEKVYEDEIFSITFNPKKI